MPEKRSIHWGGLLATAAAVLLYTWSLLFSEDFEPLLILGVLLLLPMGLYLRAKASAKPPDTENPLSVRLNGPGKPGSLERAQWASAQIRRGRSIRAAILSVLIAALAFFVENHVTGSIGCSPLEQAEATPSLQSTPTPEEAPTPAGTPAPEGVPTPTLLAPKTTSLRSLAAKVSSGTQEEDSNECTDGALAWKTHADRQGDGVTYKTLEGNNLAAIALSRGIAPSLIGPENLAAKFNVDALLAKALNLDQSTPPQKTEITIEEVSHSLQITPAQVAARFATTPLVVAQDLKVPTDRPYDPRQWADWLLWTLIGLAAYLLTQVASNLRQVVHGEGDFLGETTWYWTQLAIGPLIAFVILLLFIHIDVNLLTGDEAAVEVNLRDYPSDLLIVPAFLLGFYSRVAREVLDQMMRRIFGAAWRATNGEFEILIKGQSGDDEVEVTSMAAFETRPPTLVVWSATEGTIDSGGIFKPPTQVIDPKQVFITAIASGTNRAVTKTITVVKHKFNVVAEKNPTRQLHPGQEQKLTIEPLPTSQEEQAQIAWEFTPKGIGDKTTGPQVTLTVPKDATLGSTVTVKATYSGLSRTISFEVAEAPAS